MGFGILILLMLAFTLLWAVAFHFLRHSRFLRLAICLGFLGALMQPWTDLSLAMMAVIIGLPMIVLDVVASRPVR